MTLARPPLATAPLFFVVLLAIGVAGFRASYFARLGETDLAHHFHGIAATAWMALLIAQATLMRLRRVGWHRMLGRVSFVLVPLFLASGLLMVRTMLVSESPFSRAFGSVLAFVDLTTLAGFATAYVLAIRHRRTMALHARWLATTGLMILPPALARLLPVLLPSIQSLPAAVHGAYAIAELAAAALLVADMRRGAPKAPFASLLALLLVQHAGFVAMTASHA
jgi:hypothetical protein